MKQIVSIENLKPNRYLLGRIEGTKRPEEETKYARNLSGLSGDSRPESCSNCFKEEKMENNFINEVGQQTRLV